MMSQLFDELKLAIASVSTDPTYFKFCFGWPELLILCVSYPLYFASCCAVMYVIAFWIEFCRVMWFPTIKQLSFPELVSIGAIYACALFHFRVFHFIVFVPAFAVNSQFMVTQLIDIFFKSERPDPMFLAVAIYFVCLLSYCFAGLSCAFTVVIFSLSYLRFS